MAYVRDAFAPDKKLFTFWYSNYIGVRAEPPKLTKANSNQKGTIFKKEKKKKEEKKEKKKIRAKNHLAREHNFFPLFDIRRTYTRKPEK